MSSPILRVTEIHGERVAILDCPVPEDAPPEVTEGFARRAIVNSGGVCPCGARFTLPNRAARRRATRLKCALSVTVEHENDCPAISPALVEWVRQ